MNMMTTDSFGISIVHFEALYLIGRIAVVRNVSCGYGHVLFLIYILCLTDSSHHNDSNGIYLS